ESDRLVRQIMIRFDHSHRFAPGAHQDRMRDRGVSSYAHATQKRRVTDAGRTKNNVVTFGKVRRVKDPLQFLGKSLLDPLFFFFLVPRPHHRLEIAAKTPDRCSRQYGFWRSSNARI